MPPLNYPQHSIHHFDTLISLIILPLTLKGAFTKIRR